MEKNVIMVEITASLKKALKSYAEDHLNAIGVVPLIKIALSSSGNPSKLKH